MQLEVIKTYQFGELDINVQEKVIEKFRDLYNTNDSSLGLYLEEVLSDLLNENDIHETSGRKLYYSLGYCQGDGAIFVGHYEYKDVYFHIQQTGRYCNHGNVSIVIKDYEDKVIEEIDNPTSMDIKLDEIWSEFEELYIKICKQLEKSGYAEIEYHNSDENLKELIEATEYVFFWDGHIANGYIGN